MWPDAIAVIRRPARLALAAVAAGGWGPDALGAPNAEPPLERVRVEARAPGFASTLEGLGFDVLEHGAGVVDLVVTPDDRRRLEGLGLRAEFVARGRPLRGGGIGGGGGGGQPDEVPAGYPDLATVLGRMARAAADHPEICTMVDLTAWLGIPPTAGGRHLFAVRISDHVGIDEDEPAALVVSAHHAREIVTPVIALELIDRLTDDYGTDPDATAAVDAIEIWIAPVWNPDGYAHVFDMDNFWRKNRRPFPKTVGVDLNRNYPLGWASDCSGSRDPKSNTYKGPEPFSEAETRTMMSWSRRVRFDRVIDFHSRGREVLWSYRCLEHPLAGFLEDEAVALSEAVGYDGDQRPPSADGEHYHYQLGVHGAHAFLIETHGQFQPPYESAVEEAASVIPGVLGFLAAPIPLGGHVTDAATGAPLVASVRPVDLAYGNGETNSSGGPFGRYHAFLPPGPHQVRYAAPGYVTQERTVVIERGDAVVLDVALGPGAGPGDLDGDGDADFTDLLALLAAWGPCPPPADCPGDLDGDGAVGFTDLLILLDHWN